MDQRTWGQMYGWNEALEWAASWIEGSASDEQRQFAANMAMSIRAAKKPLVTETYPATASEADLERRALQEWREGIRDSDAQPGGEDTHNG